MPSKRERKLISKNRSAHHEYFIDETFECGIELSGTEVKSIRERACQITDTFALIRGGECWLMGVHIHPYSHGSIFNRDPDRRRKPLAATGARSTISTQTAHQGLRARAARALLHADGG